MGASGRATRLSNAARETAEQHARAKLDRFDLQNWSFRLDNARQRCGSCDFTRREITVSKHLLTSNDAEEFHATLLHEIAHALAGPGHGHDKHWRSIAHRIGARTETTNSTATMPTPRWQLICTSCEQVVARRHRRMLNLDYTRCRRCGVNAGVLRWQDGS